MATFGDILSGLTISAGQAVRRNAGNSAFEAFTPANVAGSSGEIQFNSLGAFGASSNLTWDSANNKFVVGGAISIRKNGGESRIESGTGQQFFLQGGGNGTSVSGFKISPDVSGGSFELQNLSGYIQQIFRTSGGATVGAFGISAANDCFVENPYNYKIRLIGREFYLQRDASNYAKIDVSSAGVVTFDAVGSSAKFVFSDNVEFSDAKNLVFGTTTGTQIGTASTQKIGFFGVTPITQPTITGTTTQEQIDSIVSVLESLGLANDAR